jgi:hypothetical protein
LRSEEVAKMLNSLYTDRGAFWMTLFMVVPFAVGFTYVIWRKSVDDPKPEGTSRATISRVEVAWLAVRDGAAPAPDLRSTS